MQPQKIPPFSSTRETPIAKPKQFTQEEINGRYFLLSHLIAAGTRKDNLGFIVVLDQGDDGYCRCKTVSVNAGKKENGLCYQTLTLFSGNLEPAQEIHSDIAALAAQLRKEGL